MLNLQQMLQIPPAARRRLRTMIDEKTFPSDVAAQEWWWKLGSAFLSDLDLMSAQVEQANHETRVATARAVHAEKKLDKRNKEIAKGNVVPTSQYNEKIAELTNTINGEKHRYNELCKQIQDGKILTVAKHLKIIDEILQEVREGMTAQDLKKLKEMKAFDPT